MIKRRGMNQIEKLTYNHKNFESPIGACYAPLERSFQGLLDIVLAFSKYT
jgi:hypothetical protein